MLNSNYSCNTNYTIDNIDDTIKANEAQNEKTTNKPTPPPTPSHVFFGEIRGNNGVFPIREPTKQAATSKAATKAHIPKIGAFPYIK